MTLIRPASVAGLFYPSQLQELQNMLANFMKDERVELDQKNLATTKAPKAIIGPHAGYDYSGLCTAKVYAQLEKYRDQYKRVVILGPSHRMRVPGLAVSTADMWQTPLGPVLIDQEAIGNLIASQKYPQLCTMDQAHAMEHSLEVHVPFLQMTLRNFKLIPLVVGHASAHEVSAIIESLWGDDETLIVISTDLSHFHKYEECQKIDAATAESIDRGDWEDLTGAKACGFIPVSGMLEQARSRRMKIERIFINNSGDTAGDKSRVVGYGSWVITER